MCWCKPAAGDTKRPPVPVIYSSGFFPKLISRAVNLISRDIEMGESMVGFVLKMGRVHQKWRSTVVTVWKEDDDLGCSHLESRRPEERGEWLKT
jgi:hypothetical protein